MTVSSTIEPASHGSGSRGGDARIGFLVATLALLLPASPSLARPDTGAKPAAASARVKPSAARAPRAAAAQPVQRPAPTVHRQVGVASYYGAHFHGRRMADGTRFHVGSDSAASRTLPFGTVARVTNLGNGRSAIVTIRDRGPHTRARIIDVSPAVASRLGMTKSGVARVEVVVVRRPGKGAEGRSARRRGR